MKRSAKAEEKRIGEKSEDGRTKSIAEEHGQRFRSLRMLTGIEKNIAASQNQ